MYLTISFKIDATRSFKQQIMEALDKEKKSRQESNELSEHQASYGLSESETIAPPVFAPTGLLFESTHPPVTPFNTVAEFIDGMSIIPDSVTIISMTVFNWFYHSKEQLDKPGVIVKNFRPAEDFAAMINSIPPTVTTIEIGWWLGFKLNTRSSGIREDLEVFAQGCARGYNTGFLDVLATAAAAGRRFILPQEIKKALEDYIQDKPQRIQQTKETLVPITSSSFFSSSALTPPASSSPKSILCPDTLQLVLDYLFYFPKTNVQPLSPGMIETPKEEPEETHESLESEEAQCLIS